jgi:prepilin-type N-terminal cleavage/methylation domain-containing protein
MKRQKGFSLLEVMIGLVILLVGLLGMAAMTTTSIKVNANANHLTEGYQIAQAEMEKIKNVAWASLGNGTATKVSQTGVAFTSRWTVATNGNVKDVSLDVAWLDGSTTHNVDLKTKVAR